MTQLRDNPGQIPPADDDVADRLWRREEYDQFVEMGLFDGQRVQLIEGRIIHMSPQGASHSVALELCRRSAEQACGSGYWIRVQMPFRAPDGSDPEPDIAVIEGEDPRAMKDHPATAVLVVEFADTSVSLDRRKARLYAASGVGDYWILNFVTRTLEVHRRPLPDPLASDGLGYASVRILQPDESIAPAASPDAAIRVADLLP